MKNNIYESIIKTVPKRDILEGKKSVLTFVNMLEKQHIDVVDKNVLEHAYEEEDFLDIEMLKLILDTLKIQDSVQYIPRCFEDMNAASYSAKERAILIDELLEYTILSFIFTMYSMAYDRSEENVTLCMKNFYVIEELQNRRKTIGTYDEKQLYKMSTLPENLMHMAMDSYWTIWTFLMGHELYHITHQEDMAGKATELRADQYAYRLLINLIMAQKAGKIPEHLKCFYECQYLSPIMIFEMLRLFDVYTELRGEKVVYKDHPAPEERENNIYSMFEQDIPESMDTVEGNALLNNILDSCEYAELWLKAKIK